MTVMSLLKRMPRHLLMVLGVAVLFVVWMSVKGSGPRRMTRRLPAEFRDARGKARTIVDQERSKGAAYFTILAEPADWSKLEALVQVRRVLP